MKMSRKLCIAAVVAGMGGVAMAQEQVIRIGHIGPVSGPQANFGKDNENGVRMAIDELNAKGMEIAGKKVKFQLVAEDDVADADHLLLGHGHATHAGHDGRNTQLPGHLHRALLS